MLSAPTPGVVHATLPAARELFAAGVGLVDFADDDELAHAAVDSMAMIDTMTALLLFAFTTRISLVVRLPLRSRDPARDSGCLGHRHVAPFDDSISLRCRS